MQIVSRDEASASGLKHFYTGKPCNYGHVCERITSNKACMMCHRAQSAKHRANNPEKALLRDRVYKAANREEIRERQEARRRADPEKHNRLSREWRAENLQKVVEIRKRHYAKNQEKIVAAARQKRLEDPEAQRAANKRWRERHPERAKEVTRRASAKAFATKREYMIAYIRKRKARIRQATPKWADMKAIAAKYTEARLLSIETGVPHVVDHIYPPRGKIVCGLNIAVNMQILTSAENRQKSNCMPMTEDATI